MDFTPLPTKRQEFLNGDLNKHSKTNSVKVMAADLPKFNTPMYQGLESNLPHTLMQFEDTLSPEGT